MHARLKIWGTQAAGLSCRAAHLAGERGMVMRLMFPFSSNTHFTFMPWAGRPRLQASGLRSPAFLGFTLVELLVSMAIVLMLATIGMGAMGKIKTNAYQAKSTSNLRQLGLATQLYLADHDYQFFNYQQNTPEGAIWWYGFETKASMSSSEGSRSVDKTSGPLYPYLNHVGGVEIDPGFDYLTPNWKPKYAGATYGYGYNVILCSAPDANGKASQGWSGGIPYRQQNLSSASEVMLFATCAQINTFQKGTSSSKYPVEEFPGFDQRELTFQGRFNGKALVIFTDAHVALLPLQVLDLRNPAAMIGRVTPKNSLQWLK